MFLSKLLLDKTGHWDDFGNRRVILEANYQWATSSYLILAKFWCSTKLDYVFTLIGSWTFTVAVCFCEAINCYPFWNSSINLPKFTIAEYLFSSTRGRFPNLAWKSSKIRGESKKSWASRIWIEVKPVPGPLDHFLRLDSSGLDSLACDILD